MFFEGVLLLVESVDWCDDEDVRYVVELEFMYGFYVGDGFIGI